MSAPFTVFLAAALRPFPLHARASPSPGRVRAVCFVARLAKGNDPWLRLASRIPSRKAAVATAWDLIRGSLACETSALLASAAEGRANMRFDLILND